MQNQLAFFFNTKNVLGGVGIEGMLEGDRTRVGADSLCWFRMSSELGL